MLYQGLLVLEHFELWTDPHPATGRPPLPHPARGQAGVQAETVTAEATPPQIQFRICGAAGYEGENGSGSAVEQTALGGKPPEINNSIT